jgi:hypothetical protein
MFRNPETGNSAQIKANIPLTPNKPPMDPSQQESIATSSDDTKFIAFSSGKDPTENIAPFNQVNIPNGQNEATEAPLTVPAAIQFARKVTPNFSRREVVSRKSALRLHPLDGHPSPQAVQAPGLSELSAMHADVENHRDMTLKTATAVSPHLTHCYKIILLGAGAVGKSPLAMQVSAVSHGMLPAHLIFIIVRLPALRTLGGGRRV